MKRMLPMLRFGFPFHRVAAQHIFRHNLLQTIYYKTNSSLYMQHYLLHALHFAVTALTRTIAKPRENINSEQTVYTLRRRCMTTALVGDRNRTGPQNGRGDSATAPERTRTGPRRAHPTSKPTAAPFVPVSPRSGYNAAQPVHRSTNSVSDIPGPREEVVEEPRGSVYVTASVYITGCSGTRNQDINSAQILARFYRANKPARFGARPEPELRRAVAGTRRRRARGYGDGGTRAGGAEPQRGSNAAGQRRSWAGA